MQVQTYRLPIAAFPRMNYAYKHSLEIYNKYKSFTADFVEQEIEKATHDEVVVLHICKKQTECQFPVELNNVIREGNELTQSITTYRDIHTFLKERPKFKGFISVLVLDLSFLDQTAEIWNESDLFAFITSSETNIGETQTDNYIVTSKDRVGFDISNCLEKVVLKPMSGICASLQKARNHFPSFQNANGKRAYNSSNVDNDKISATVKNEIVPDRSQLIDQGISSGNTNVEEGTCINSKAHLVAAARGTYTPLMKKQKVSHRKSSTTGTRNGTVDKKKQNVKKKKSRDVTELQDRATDDIQMPELIDRETVESLLKSIKVLYGMSNIPENERPHILEDEGKILSEELCNDLFSISKDVKGVGYYCNTLRVLVSDQANGKETRVKEKVEHVLKQHYLTKYEILKTSENIQNLMHVGAKLEPVPGYGTLGCFAKMGGEIRCILLSGHVASCCKDIYFENKRKVCQILEATYVKEGELDIAAAKIFPQEAICSTNFMDSEGKEMEGKLREYVDDDKVITEEQKVYIWGASSKPGKGIIALPRYVIQNEKHKQILMQIKDNEYDKPFAVEGDSEAIVCTDDPDGDYVHVLGMVIGEGLMGENGKVYYALPLSDGLKQLQRKTGQTFELC